MSAFMIWYERSAHIKTAQSSICLLCWKTESVSPGRPPSLSQSLDVMVSQHLPKEDIGSFYLYIFVCEKWECYFPHVYWWYGITEYFHFLQVLCILFSTLLFIFLFLFRWTLAFSSAHTSLIFSPRPKISPPLPMKTSWLKSPHCISPFIISSST